MTTTLKKLDIIEELFFDDIFDIWDHISELKSYHPEFLYYANFNDYYNFIICYVLELELENTDPYYYGNNITDDSEVKRIYNKFYQITKKLIKEINKQLLHTEYENLQFGIFYDWINKYSILC